MRCRENKMPGSKELRFGYKQFHWRGVIIPGDSHLLKDHNVLFIMLNHLILPAAPLTQVINCCAFRLFCSWRLLLYFSPWQQASWPDPLLYSYTWKRTNFSMQRRWKRDQYLSYLSAPPLLCCCSSLWSPERWRQATRNGWTHGLESGRSELWVDMFGHFTHTDTWTTWRTDRTGGRTAPSQEHKPARTPESEQQDAPVLRWPFVIVSPRKYRNIPNGRESVRSRRAQIWF